MNDDMPDVVLPDEVCNALREAELDGVVDGVLTLEVWRRLSAADQAALVAGGEKAMVTPRMSIAQAHAMGAA